MIVQLKTIRLETNGQEIDINPWLKNLDIMDVNFLKKETHIIMFIAYKVKGEK